MYSNHSQDTQIVVVIDMRSLFRDHLHSQNSKWDPKQLVDVDRWLPFGGGHLLRFDAIYGLFVKYDGNLFNLVILDFVESGRQSISSFNLFVILLWLILPNIFMRTVPKI